MSRRTTDATERARARRRPGGRAHCVLAVVSALGQVVGLFAEAVAAQPTLVLRPVPTVLHAHSTWSSGSLSLEDLVAHARSRNVEAVFWPRTISSGSNMACHLCVGCCDTVSSIHRFSPRVPRRFSQPSTQPTRRSATS